MKKAHASKKNNQQLFKIVLRPECPFCGSGRLFFYSCSDDWGDYAATKCLSCGTEGPNVRDHRGGHVTNEMRAEAAARWNRIWDNIAGPPREVIIYLDADGQQVGQPTIKPRLPLRRLLGLAKPKPKPRTKAVRTPAVDAPAYSPALAEEHQAVIIPAPKSTNGLNGHHNGSVL